jgi:hypothetical protein
MSELHMCFECDNRHIVNVRLWGSRLRDSHGASTRTDRSTSEEPATSACNVFVRNGSSNVVSGFAAPITPTLAKGISLYLLKAVLSGRVDDVIDLAGAILWRWELARCLKAVLGGTVGDRPRIESNEIRLVRKSE